MRIYLNNGNKIITKSLIKIGDNKWRYQDDDRHFKDIKLEDISAIHDK